MISSRHRLRMTAAACGMAAVALLGAACNGSGSGSGDGDKKGSGSSNAASGNGSSMDQGLKLAKCMREHGVNMPDPKAGEDSHSISIGGDGSSPEKIQKAMDACRKVPGTGLSSQKELTQAQKDKMIKFAQCMRQNGVNMPDPKFSSGGGAAPAMRLPDAGPEKDKFDKANKACAAYA
ncbi:hypothetical protein J4573_01580 [Actinomadura barringtoniae]|uniref:Secreted protein n=1 Tax=Actinomadura barringtoniae TaxID=1427535 RepID=A0A939P632_9ACTN|nr:hypothetical protein [Actinomadura barringtoniae]MBO2445770.1 hypothetical protein [Actinomadura barringtoniae]